jgi:hypothetical protein
MSKYKYKDSYNQKNYKTEFIISCFRLPKSRHKEIPWAKEIKIMNSLGQQVFLSTVNQQLFNIDITNWGGNGMYFLQLIDNSGNIIDIRKILLQ